MCQTWEDEGNVFLKAVGILPTTFRNTYADKITPGNETNIHVACRAGLDQNRIPPLSDAACECLPLSMLVESSACSMPVEWDA